MSVLAIKVVRARVPTAIILHVWALLCIANEVQVRWPPEILLSMCVVTVRPLMLLVDMRAKTGFVRVYHEFFYSHLLLVLFQIKGKSSFRHKISHCATLLCRERKWINPLLFLIQWLYPFHEILSTEAM